MRIVYYKRMQLVTIEEMNVLFGQSWKCDERRNGNSRYFKNRKALFPITVIRQKGTIKLKNH